MWQFHFGVHDPAHGRHINGERPVQLPKQRGLAPVALSGALDAAGANDHVRASRHDEATSDVDDVQRRRCGALARHDRSLDAGEFGGVGLHHPSSSGASAAV